MALALRNISTFAGKADTAALQRISSGRFACQKIAPVARLFPVTCAKSTGTFFISVREENMKAPRNRAASLALSLLFVTGAASMSLAKTFVYVSNAQDSNIDGYIMDSSNGTLTPIGKTEAAKLVMPMTVSP